MNIFFVGTEVPLKNCLSPKSKIGLSHFSNIVQLDLSEAAATLQFQTVFIFLFAYVSCERL
jgi:hypothetical protein